MEFQKLVVYHYGETSEDDRRVTISPMQVNLIAFETEDTIVNGRSLRRASVLFSDGSSCDLAVNHQDMSTLEEAVGAYCLG